MAHFSNFQPNPNLKNEPNHFLKNFFIFQISKCTHFFIIEMITERCLLSTKNKAAVALYNPPHPFRTPCTYKKFTHLRTENTLAILPMALILFRITSFLSLACAVKNKLKNRINNKKKTIFSWILIKTRCIKIVFLLFFFVSFCLMTFQGKKTTFFCTQISYSCICNSYLQNIILHSRPEN